jgi:general secretion pathway protein E
MGLAVNTWRAPAGCPACTQTGYRGRLLIAEYLNPRLDAIGRAILDRCDATALQSIAADSGMATLLDRARTAIEAGQTSPAEIRRVFGADSRSESPPGGSAISP